MNTMRIDHGDQRCTASRFKPRVKRAILATLVMTVLTGGGYLWQQASSARTAHRAEQARIDALQITPRKMQALEREAEIAAAAKAFAQRMAAEKALREAPPAAHATGAAPRGAHDSHI